MTLARTLRFVNVALCLLGVAAFIAWFIPFRANFDETIAEKMIRLPAALIVLTPQVPTLLLLAAVEIKEQRSLALHSVVSLVIVAAAMVGYAYSTIFVMAAALD